MSSKEKEKLSSPFQNVFVCGSIHLSIEEMGLATKIQHLHFQMYLNKEKDEVHKKLKQKIFPTTSYSDYEFTEILGQGSYGMVALAENLQNKEKCAVKIIKKKNLVKRECLNHLLSEIRILNAVNFQFVISLKCYFTNHCCVFLVLPHINGGRFFELLRKNRKFEEHVAMFFAGQIVLAIEYLHYMGIVYRDLKPENLMLDVEGYLKLIDFGFAKAVGHNYSYSFCGTPEYLAPEILQNKGHNVSPDWWTFGVLLYEMCDGRPPFTAVKEILLFQKILRGSVQWPSHFSYDLKSIIQGLLQVDKTKRLGCMRHKAQDIKFHKWFSPLNWNALLNKKISPPITLSATNVRTRPFTSQKETSVEKCNTIIPNEMIGNIDFSI